MYMKLTALIALAMAALLLFGCAVPAAPADPEDGAQDPSAPAVGTDSVQLSRAAQPGFAEGSWYELYQALPAGLMEGYSDFAARSAQKLLTAADASENRLYSPISLYVAMAMLAECTASSTRDEILAAMNMQPEQLESGTKAFADMLCAPFEGGKFSLYNSAWLSDSAAFKQAAVDSLASDMFADTFAADFTGEKYKTDIADWVTKSTEGFLTASPDSFTTDPATILMLINTAYYKDEWTDPINPANNITDTFTDITGAGTEQEFMVTYDMGNFARGANYTAANMSLKNGRMRFVLPDDGVSPYDLIADPAALAELMDTANDACYGDINWKIPKFSYDSDLDLSAMMQALGVNSAFAPDSADFSALTDMPAYLSCAMQQSRIAIDENGIEVASCTRFYVAGCAMPTDQADMILDRPFLYIIYRGDVPAFVGIVNFVN